VKHVAVIELNNATCNGWYRGVSPVAKAMETVRKLREIELILLFSYKALNEAARQEILQDIGACGLEQPCRLLEGRVASAKAGTLVTLAGISKHVELQPGSSLLYVNPAYVLLSSSVVLKAFYTCMEKLTEKEQPVVVCTGRQAQIANGGLFMQPVTAYVPACVACSSLALACSFAQLSTLNAVIPIEVDYVTGLSYDIATDRRLLEAIEH
jgi:hypothetical protein